MPTSDIATRSLLGVGDSRLVPMALSETERQVLSNWARRRTTAQGLALRARIVLACAESGPNLAVAARLGVNRSTVATWRTRFLRDRFDGLADEPRPGVPRTITDTQVEEVVVRTLEQTPEGGTHWSKRELARAVGISSASALRIWHAFGLQPWRTELVHGADRTDTESRFNLNGLADQQEPVKALEDLHVLASGRCRPPCEGQVADDAVDVLRGDVPCGSAKRCGPAAAAILEQEHVPAPARWTKTFTDPHLCAAIVDRPTFNSTIIETGTDSYRLASVWARAEELAKAG